MWTRRCLKRLDLRRNLFPHSGHTWRSSPRWIPRCPLSTFLEAKPFPHWVHWCGFSRGLFCSWALGLRGSSPLDLPAVSPREGFALWTGIVQSLGSCSVGFPSWYCSCSEFSGKMGARSAFPSKETKMDTYSPVFFLFWHIFFIFSPDIKIESMNRNCRCHHVSRGLER